ncbi:carbonic anhydrase 9-like, partial [Hyalella azteca]|uniref:Carbonic anhydrase n=1 Tax=Hyalella azteca TaxID=294128 RepID=A0A979FV23_HYAAZ
MHLVVTLMMFISLGIFVGGDPSSYKYDDKDEWPLQFPLHCSRHRQSPINIRDSIAAAKTVDDLLYTNYEFPPSNVTATNNHHTLSLTGTFPMGLPLLSGGGLIGVYEVTNLHFHWGSDDSQGSEHTIDGQRFPPEMHIVHNKQGTDRHSFLADKQGLAVLSVLFHVSPADNEALTPILEAIPAIISGEQSAVLQGASALSALLPRNKQVFYRYPGSLTTPPCSQAVA